MLCCDVKKCFDSVHLSDMNYFLLSNNADLKAVKLFQILTGENDLRVQGSEKTFHISNGEGQGGNIAARSTSGGMTEVIERHMLTHPNPMTFNKVNVACDCFVDDMGWQSCVRSHGLIFLSMTLRR